MPNTLPPHLVRSVSFTQPLQWLQKGWHDMVRIGWPSYLHGVAITTIGIAICWAFFRHFWLLVGSLTGFLVIAPVLATGLYTLSRALQRQQSANWHSVVNTWLQWQHDHPKKWGDNDYWCQIQFGCLLTAAASLWVLTSSAFITLLAPAPITQPLDFLRHVILAPDNTLFVGWLVLGGALAAPMFASSVITMPLLLDRKVSLRQAIYLSWYSVLANPITMAFWASLILLLTLVGFATAMVGLVLVIPVLGHASWHAYCDLVDQAQMPQR